MEKEIKVKCEECKKTFPMRVDVKKDLDEMKTGICPYCNKETKITIKSMFGKKN